MLYRHNYILGAPLTKAGRVDFKGALLKRFEGDMEKAAGYIEHMADRQISKSVGLLGSSSLLAGLSYFLQSRVALALILVAFLLALSSFYPKWPADASVFGEPDKDINFFIHVCVVRCVSNAISTFLIFTAVLLLAFELFLLP